MVAVVNARLNHCPFKPFVKSGDGDPLRITGHSCLPTGTIGRAIIAGYDVGKRAPRDFGVIVAGQDASRPNFLGMVRPVVSINFAAKPLINGLHVIVEDTPIARAEEVNTIKNIQHVDVYAFRRERGAAKATAVIVSSSPLLAKVCRERDVFLGDDPLVLSVAALATP